MQYHWLMHISALKKDLTLTPLGSIAHTFMQKVLILLYEILRGLSGQKAREICLQGHLCQHHTL
jgi:hypothetical protein